MDENCRDGQNLLVRTGRKGKQLCYARAITNRIIGGIESTTHWQRRGAGVVEYLEKVHYESAVHKMATLKVAYHVSLCTRIVSPQPEKHVHRS